ncbi:hypothetical protein [Salirhabdus salicampi]|uniref:hypothetical protein n=1 Tax=Salirhabdus salicampi TaxID=476102 RepID=UPI0020C3C795|nr:hypothetical protein [Salirhabdus salicampi]MCP8616206.1 hypothetical protein [Salirhabdus salicampi]
MILVFLLIWKIMDVKWWFSLIVTFVGYVVASGVIQSAIYLILLQIGLVGSTNLATPEADLVELMTIQFLYGIIVCHMSMAMVKKRFGLMFILDDLSFQELKQPKFQFFLLTTVFGFVMYQYCVYVVKVAPSASFICIHILLVLVSLASLVSFFLIIQSQLKEHYEEIRKNIQL